MRDSLLSILTCPRDGEKLSIENNSLVCPNNHRYAIIDDIPVLLLDDVDVTHPAITRSIELSNENSFTERLKHNLQSQIIHPFVQKEIGATNGNLYAPLIGKLQNYPIPKIRLPQGQGELLLDIGCNWGRWSLSAAQMGYKVIGLDPSLEAVLAARDVAMQQGLQDKIDFIVGDARYLPFQRNSFDVCFSYSVLQHFSKEDARQAISQIAHVLKEDGFSLVQMPNKIGLRNTYNQMRNVGEDSIFRVRYWGVNELREAFTSNIGNSDVTVDGFFGLGIQPSDIAILPPHYKLVIICSEILRRMSLLFPPLSYLADSLYIKSTK